MRTLKFVFALGFILGGSMLLSAADGQAAVELEETIEFNNDIIPEGTLFIGMDVSAEDESQESIKSRQEIFGKDTPAVFITRRFMVQIVESLHKVNPEQLWMDLAQDEAGITKRLAIEGMSPSEQLLMKQHLCYYGIGCAEQMPLKYAFKTYNMFSKLDPLPKKSSKKHAGRGNKASIHQRALAQLTEKTREKFGFYDGNPENSQTNR